MSARRPSASRGRTPGSRPQTCGGRALTTRAPALNDRQRAYLLAIFETDQAEEAAWRDEPYRPFQPRPKASEWRWLEYSEPEPLMAWPGSRLWQAIKKASKIDQGTGATFSSLADRGLITVRWKVRNARGNTVPYLRMTTSGRRLVRSWTGQKAYKAPPAGTLKEWHWRALAKAYVAGDEGLEGEYGVYARIGERTWQRLLEYKRGALVEESPRRSLGTPVRRLFITANGRALYHDQWARYRELYPDVEAPEPARATAAGAAS
jgi:hypothetical protein